jgi:hypothetical protein
VRVRGVVLGIVATLLIASVGWSAPQDDPQGPQYADASSAFPDWSFWLFVDCPANAMDPSLGWGAPVPQTYHVPQWGLASYLTDYVSFYSAASTRDDYQYVSGLGKGHAWYNPSPSTAMHMGMEFSWQSDRPSYKGAFAAICFKQCILWGDTCWLSIWGDNDVISGYAIPIGDQFGTDERDGGGGSGYEEWYDCNGVMLERYNWWIDSGGNYQEEVIGRWCVEEGKWEE